MCTDDADPLRVPRPGVISPVATLNNEGGNAMQPQQTSDVSMRALIQRINRRLAKNGERLHRYRGGQWSTDLGEFYIRDEYRNFLVQGHVDPEALGRELGVLKGWEGVQGAE
jgi:hypothetical protein